jgi:hypothetical protein
VTTAPQRTRRRSRTERKALAFLRGEVPASRMDGTRCCFARLRRLAPRYGHAVLPPGTLYVSDGELALLGWIAQAQRLAGMMSSPDSRYLAALLVTCAEQLTGLGLHLPPRTFHALRLRNLV